MSILLVLIFHGTLLVPKT